ncbi:MAG: hypothetical protein MAG453_00092 [Calditrichaeota bacterium]|nr:hypothetical protein [Calditrichota bacterium]
MPGPNSYSGTIDVDTDEPDTYSTSVSGDGETVIKTWDGDPGWTMFSLPYIPVEASFDSLFADDLAGAASTSSSISTGT